MSKVVFEGSPVNTIPDDVTIGEGAFQLCEALKSVPIPKSLTRIEPCAFMGCRSLRRIDGLEHSQVQILHNDAFKGCSSLETIYLPAGLRKIGAGVFIPAILLRGSICR